MYYLDLEAKECFFHILFKTVASLIQSSSKDGLSFEIQKSYASMMTTIGCNAEIIPLKKKDILFKREVLAANSFLTMINLIAGKGKQLRGVVVEFSIKMLRENGMEFSQALQLHQKIIEAISNSCLLECIQSKRPIYTVLRNVSTQLKIFNL